MNAVIVGHNDEWRVPPSDGERRDAKRKRAVMSGRAASGRLRARTKAAALLVVLFGWAASLASGEPAGLSVHQLSAEVGQEARLACLVGRPQHCGEPYFIAWYKMNVSSRGWTRLEHKSEEELHVGGAGSPGAASTSALDPRVRFSYTKGGALWSACEQLHAAQAQLQSVGSARATNQPAAAFDCAQLSISALKLSDEGQYKCEITFSEALDFDKCPASTLSQLSVTARPNEPELLVNGRPVQQQQQPLTFKEGAQVRLECQSSGGKPAPRIEWLNVSEPAAGADSLGAGQLVHLMRAQKRLASSGELAADSPLQAGHAPAGQPHHGHSHSQQQQPQPLSASSLTVTLSRYDLATRFLCLVVPAASAGASHASLEQLLRSPGQVGALLAAASGPRAGPPVAGAPMLKWIKLDVQVKPSQVSVSVRDLESEPTGALLQPVHWQQAWQGQRAASAQAGQPAADQASAPFYSLQLGRLYALQCRVENSRPVSQLVWFNRTSPVAVEPARLNETDFELPAEPRRHRLTSFVRSIGHENGTFSTVATLLLTTNAWDNFEELFCRASNEAFHSDEMVQVAPIMPLNLYVNYAPLAWLEADEAQWSAADPSSGRLRAEPGAAVGLRCFVAANPLAQNAILQIEWLRDGRKLAASRQLLIERANHLHMPAARAGARPGPSASLAASQLAQGSKLMSASSLTLPAVARHDAGAYSCHFKLIPAPATASAGASPPQSLRITSGQAPQTLHVELAEAKWRAPTLRLASTRPMLVYGLHSAGASSAAASPSGRRLAVVVEADAQLSARCDPPANQASPATETAPLKASFLLDEAPLHSGPPADAYNFSLGSLAQPARHLGPLSCALQTLGGAPGADNFHGRLVRLHSSANELDVRSRVGPRLLDRRDLMPPVRSFSELELTATPTNRLRLVCVAQCEPLCAIDWHLDGRPLLSYLRPAEAAPPRAGAEPAMALDGGPFLGHMTLADAVEPAPNGSAFAFVRDTNLLASDSSRPGGAQEWPLANVIARLELTYKQIEALLRARHQQPPAHQQPPMGQEEGASEAAPELRIGCRTSALFAGPTALLMKSARQSASAAADGAPANGELALGQALVPAARWFPAGAHHGGQFAGVGGAGLHGLASEPVAWFAPSANLSSPKSAGHHAGRKGGDNDGAALEAASASGRPGAFVDEMQIRILLDKPPRGATVALAGVASSNETGAQLVLTEGQLAELADPSKPAQQLRCRALGSPYPPVHYKWSFTDLNRTEHSIAADGPQLSLRQLVEFRQRQLQLPAADAAPDLDVLAGLVGNYTCTTGNVLGARAASLGIQIRGRPLCKLTLGAGFLAPDNGLMARLRCQVLAQPAVHEVVWFRNGQQTALNKSGALPTSALSHFELAVGALNSHQEFLLTDLIAPGATGFRCVARNAFGYSDPCDLSAAHKQALLNLFRPMGSPHASLIDSLLGEAERTNRAKQSAGDLFAVPRQLAGRLDWLLMLGCAFLLTWLVFLAGASVARRLQLAPGSSSGSSSASRLVSLKGRRAGGGGSSKRRGSHAWRFHSGSEGGASRADELAGAFRCAAKGSGAAANYYGDSTAGDSEHDMMQSCSQSSHYDDFLVQRQLLAVHQTAQPVYFNAAGGCLSTLQRRSQPQAIMMKSSLSAGSSTGNESAHTTGSSSNTTGRARHHDRPAGAQMATVPSRLATMPERALARPLVPLVDGNHHNTSRINLQDQQQAFVEAGPTCATGANGPVQPHSQPQPVYVGRFARADPHLQRGEHIYDDVIYNQMIM